MDTRSFESEWRRRFEEFAESEDTDAAIAGWSETGLEARLKAFTKYWTRRPPGERWLDLGCGAGTYSRILSTQGLEVVGADYSHQTLIKARSRSATTIRWLSADARKLPFADASFDGILCFGVTQTLAETFPVAAEAARVLRPGGEYWIDALNGRSLFNAFALTRRRLNRLPDHLRYEQMSSLKRSLERAGFAMIGAYWLPIAPPAWRRLQQALESRIIQATFRAVPTITSLLSHSFILQARR